MSPSRCPDCNRLCMHMSEGARHVIVRSRAQWDSLEQLWISRAHSRQTM
jgi:hypothetical protein